jgi:hypothetical protein
MSEYSKEELKNSKRIYKSATPKYTIDWYIKWISSIILLSAMMVRSNPELTVYDQGLSLIGCFGWLLVALIWKDRALIILNAAAVIILGSGLINTITGV